MARIKARAMKSPEVNHCEGWRTVVKWYFGYHFFDKRLVNLPWNRVS